MTEFRRCATPGCETLVYAPLNLPVTCVRHGGNPSLPNMPADDEYGLPLEPGSSPAPGPDDWEC